jgi:hypothetical protein
MTRERLSALCNTAIFAGVVLQLGGLVWDVRSHSVDTGLAAHEDVVNFSNPGHVLLFLGMGLAVTGIVVRQVFASEGDSVLRRAVLPVGLATLAAGALTYAFTASFDDGHSHADDAATTARDAELEGLSERDRALVGESRHDHATEIPLQQGDLELLMRQLASVRESTAAYQDLAAARRDGYVQVTQDIPLIGAHFINPEYVADGVFDPARPEMLIYTHRDGDWLLYGASFITRLFVEGDEPIPEGFAGPLDVWHYHSNWCFTIDGAWVTEDADECGALRGLFVPKMGYMMHVWFRDNPTGVFAHSHPELKGSDALIIDLPGLLRLLAAARED